MLICLFDSTQEFLGTYKPKMDLISSQNSLNAPSASRVTAPSNKSPTGEEKVKFIASGPITCGAITGNGTMAQGEHKLSITHFLICCFYREWRALHLGLFSGSRDLDSYQSLFLARNYCGTGGYWQYARSRSDKFNESRLCVHQSDTRSRERTRRQRIGG